MVSRLAIGCTEKVNFFWKNRMIWQHISISNYVFCTCVFGNSHLCWPSLILFCIICGSYFPQWKVHTYSIEVENPYECVEKPDLSSFSFFRCVFWIIIVLVILTNGYLELPILFKSFGEDCSFPTIGKFSHPWDSTVMYRLTVLEKLKLKTCKNLYVPIFDVVCHLQLTMINKNKENLIKKNSHIFNSFMPTVNPHLHMRYSNICQQFNTCNALVFCYTCTYHTVTVVHDLLPPFNLSI